MLVPEEWEAYRTLRLRALREDPLAFGSTYESEREFGEDRWRERLSPRSPLAPAATWAAADSSDRLLGTVVAARVEGDFHIFGMWVAPEARRRGIGGRLLDQALDWIEQSSAGAVVLLDVNPRELPAVQLYQSRGFQFTGASRSLGHHGNEICSEMRRHGRVAGAGGQ